MPAVRYQEVKDVLDEDVSRGWTLAMGAADLDGDLLPELYLANDFGPDRLLHNRSTPGSLRFAVLEGQRDFTTPKSCVAGTRLLQGDGRGFRRRERRRLPRHLREQHRHQVRPDREPLPLDEHGRGRGHEAGDRPLRPCQREARPGAQRVLPGRRGWPTSTTTACSRRCRPAASSRGRSIAGPSCRRSAPATTRSSTTRGSGPTSSPAPTWPGTTANPSSRGRPTGATTTWHAELGLAEPMVSRGIAIADVDGDGRLDFVTANQWGPSYLFRNESPGAGAFLEPAAGPRRRLSGHRCRGQGQPAGWPQAGRRRSTAATDTPGTAARTFTSAWARSRRAETGAVALAWRDLDGKPRRSHRAGASWPADHRAHRGRAGSGAAAHRKPMTTRGVQHDAPVLSQRRAPGCACSRSGTSPR